MRRSVGGHRPADYFCLNVPTDVKEAAAELYLIGILPLQVPTIRDECWLNGDEAELVVVELVAADDPMKMLLVRKGRGLHRLEWLRSCS